MRSARCWTRCDQRPTLPSTNWIIFGVIFAVGLLLFGIGSAMLRSLREERPAPAQPSWPQLIDESLAQAGTQLRLDMVERLSIIDTDWSRSVLERARAEDPDEAVRAAVELALSR